MVRELVKALPKISPFLKIHLIAAVASHKRVGDDGNIAQPLILKITWWTSSGMCFSLSFSLGLDLRHTARWAIKPMTDQSKKILRREHGPS